MKGQMQIYYDEEGDFLEINIGKYTEGYFKEVGEKMDKIKCGCKVCNAEYLDNETMKEIEDAIKKRGIFGLEKLIRVTKSGNCADISNKQKQDRIGSCWLKK